jgi:hypothetical protein
MMKRLCTWLGGLAVFLAGVFSHDAVFAWGERGHHAICEVATRLTREAPLAQFLKSRGHMMGHLCNIPDIYWRGLGEQSRSGNPTHYIEPDRLGLTFAEFPADLTEVLKQYDGKENAKLGRVVNLLDDVGSLWWRADQFFRRAVDSAKQLNSPANAKPHDEKAAYEKAVFDMIVAMGVMGHFVGDVSMPYHNTIDFDGWDKGRGGIHSYYESQCVDALPMDLTEQVYTLAKTLPRRSTSEKPRTVPERMREMSIIAYGEIGKVEAMDKILKPSAVKEENGTSVRTPAQRPTPDEAAKRFGKLILPELARSARLLAELWDDIYIQAGKPNLSKYRSFKYPLQPDFVPPDYAK